MEFKEDASRLELFVRLLWAIPTGIVLYILSLIGLLFTVVQFLHILVLGKRMRFAHSWLFKLNAYHVKWSSYFYLTDERSPIWPED